MTADNTAIEAATPLFADGKGREVVAPDFGGAPVADTHAHLDMLDDPAPRSRAPPEPASASSRPSPTSPRTRAGRTASCPAG